MPLTLQNMANHNQGDGSKSQDFRCQELRKEIQKGLDSGPATPLDMEAIKARGRARLKDEGGKCHADT